MGGIPNKQMACHFRVGVYRDTACEFVKGSQKGKTKKGKKLMKTDLFQMVKENVSPLQAAHFYGLRVNRNGMACCPFHNDRHPSMKLDAKNGGGFHCFGCQEGGDVITLVARLFGSSNYDAAKKIANDFGLSVPRENSFESEETEAQRLQRERLTHGIRKRELCKNLLAHLSDLRKVKYQTESEAMKAMEENEAYSWVIGRLDQVEDYYDYLLDAPEAELKENIGEIERRLSESVREFDEIRGRSERAS